MVSVVIPVYNRVELLKIALKSVYNQTELPTEIIIIDDQSEASMKDELENFLKAHEQVETKIFRNDKQMGAAGSRNIGVNLSKSSYIAFLDSDDYWESTKLEKQCKLLEMNNDVGLVYCDQWIVNSNGEKKPSGKLMIEDNLWQYLLEGWTAPNTSTLLFNKSFFTKLGGFDENLTSCQDHDLWMRIGLDKGNVKYVDQKLSYFNHHDKKRISTDSEKRIKGAKVFLEKWRNDIEKTNGNDKYRSFYNEYMYKVVVPIIRNELGKHNYLKSIRLYANNLIFNHFFYKQVFKKVIS